MTDKSPRKYVYAGTIEEAHRLEVQAKAQEVMIRKELEAIELRSGIQVLDAGCGTGAITRMIAREITPGKVYGVDIDPVFIGEAERLVIEEDFPNIHYQLGDICNLEFDDDFFDATYCRLVLMHVKDPVLVLSEFKRVTKQNGIIAVSDFDDGTIVVYPPFPMGLNLWGKFGEIAKSRGDDRYIGRKLFSFFSQIGLESIKIIPVPIAVTQQTPHLLQLAMSVPIELIRTEKEALISQGYTTEQGYKEGVEELNQFLKHPEAFLMTTSFIATGRVP